MYWEWTNCLKTWHRQFGRGDKKISNASYDLGIWHVFFEVAGANKDDLNVLSNSPIFNDLIDDITHVAPFEVKRVTYEKKGLPS